MSRGNILYGLGALVVIVCFFLPWMEAMGISLTGLNTTTGVYQGIHTGEGEALFWIVLASAVVGLIVAGLAFTGALPRRLAGLLAILMGAAVLLMLSWKLIDWDYQGFWEAREYVQYGLWGTIGGGVAKVIGGLIDLF